MKLNLKYFGMIAESAGKSEEKFSFTDGNTVAELKAQIVNLYNIKDPGTVQIAVNQDLNVTSQLKEDDEVAFLPPFAGG
ncbi:molybdopterin synthase subunit MoaD [Nonlabens sp. Hel1_33_55]|uniref:MoaD/ThiS family protein n=1 Tax=Nonlabens sp. Hel1_33_55 TaxID=1336802 RepID=UPI000875D9B9|nr:MoaD/ThiS family protein [Nonlabens sp. Hel1_33_55]SCX98900.1 molybdopterin synthase subunit MoaD [Nonlabens sp. Hel1_33_55]